MFNASLFCPPDVWAIAFLFIDFIETSCLRFIDAVQALGLSYP